MRKAIDFEHWAAVAICLGTVLLLLRFFSLPLLAALLPFLLAAGLAVLLDPLAKKLAGRLHWNRQICALLLFLLCMTIVLLLGGLLVAVLLREGQALLANLLADIGSPSSLISNAVDALRLPDTAEGEAFRLQLKALLTDFSAQVVGELAAKLPVLAGKMASGIPSAFFFLVVTMAAGAKFCLHGRQIWASFTGRLPWKHRIRPDDRRAKAAAFLRRYLRAYLLLFLLTFALLLAGFEALGVGYALAAALLVALLDLLPVLGVGTVLIPWGILELLCRQYYLGFGLLILCLAITVARQIAEPHLVGKSLGVSPFLSLAAGYAGWKFAGVAGLLAGPLLLPVLKRAIVFSLDKKEAGE